MRPTPKLHMKGQIWEHNSFNWAGVVWVVFTSSWL